MRESMNRTTYTAPAILVDRLHIVPVSLRDALSAAVAVAVRQGAGAAIEQAAGKAVREAMASPDMLTLLAAALAHQPLPSTGLAGTSRRERLRPARQRVTACAGSALRWCRRVLAKLQDIQLRLWTARKRLLATALLGTTAGIGATLIGPWHSVAVGAMAGVAVCLNGRARTWLNQFSSAACPLTQSPPCSEPCLAAMACPPHAQAMDRGCAAGDRVL